MLKNFALNQRNVLLYFSATICRRGVWKPICQLQNFFKGDVPLGESFTSVCPTQLCMRITASIRYGQCNLSAEV